MKNLVFIILTFVLVMSSCNTTVEPEPEVTRGTIIVDQNITENTTWYGNKIYKVTNSIDVTNRALLTIEPGCIVKFVNDVELSIAFNDYGMVIARGTKENPILFTSEAPNKLAGDWYGFYFYEGSEGSEFNYCTIEYAGGYSATQAAVNLRGGRVSFLNCTVRESESFGFEVRNEAEFTGFAYNTITSTKYDPMKVTGNSVRTIGDFNVYDQGTRIEVKPGIIDEPGFHYWEDQPIPFYIPDDMEVGSVSATGTELIIAPGTVIEFAPSSELSVGISNRLGKLTFIGELNNPIVLTSSSAVPNNGDWDGVWFYTSTQPNTKMEHCVITYGGGYSYGGNVIMRNEVGNNVEISNSTISNSGQYGVYKKIDDPAPTLTNINFSNNTLGNTNW